MLEEIKNELGAYYSNEDEVLLNNILKEVTSDALSISNQEDKKILKSEIKECVKVIYLRRGTEHNSSLNANGESSSFIDPVEEMRKNIIKNGKRGVY